MRRRQFLWAASSGLILSRHTVRGQTPESAADLTRIPTSLRQPDDWTMVGRKQWTEDLQGVIYNPTWTHFAGDVLAYWPHETDDRQYQDFAFLHKYWLAELDLSVKVKLFNQGTTNSIAFRAQDSRRFYELAMRSLYEKGVYELTLWVEEASGFRRRLAYGLAGTMEILTAAGQHPKWDTVRISARGPQMEAWLNQERVISVEDDTYAAGVIGLSSLGRVQYSDLHVCGRQAVPDRPWQVIPGEAPPYVYPYKSDTADLHKPTPTRMSWPTGAVLSNGEILLMREIIPWGIYGAGKSTKLVRSQDHGRTWNGETRFEGLALSLPFEHRDGRLSALSVMTFDEEGNIINKFTPEMYLAIDQGKLKTRRETMRVYSTDRGQTWGEPQPFLIEGKPLSAYGNFWVFSGFRRLSDGALLWTPYFGKTENTRAEERTNQTFALRSEDDGQTWSVPVPVETTRKDTNEGSAAELANGDLLIFMRSVRAAHLWKARSKDKGRTWLPLEKTEITLDCPQFLRTRDGILVLQTRDGAVQYSPDDGTAWSPVWNIGRFIHMGCLLETGDGALLVAHLDAGFADITKVRASRFRVSAKSLLPAD